MQYGRGKLRDRRAVLRSSREAARQVRHGWAGPRTWSCKLYWNLAWRFFEGGSGGFGILKRCLRAYARTQSWTDTEKRSWTLDSLIAPSAWGDPVEWRFQLHRAVFDGVSIANVLGSFVVMVSLAHMQCDGKPHQ